MLKERVLLSGVNVTSNKLVVKLEFCMQLFKELDSSNRGVLATTLEMFRRATANRIRRHGDVMALPRSDAILS